MPWEKQMTQSKRENQQKTSRPSQTYGIYADLDLNPQGATFGFLIKCIWFQFQQTTLRE